MANNTHFISNRPLPPTSDHATRSPVPRGTPLIVRFGHIRRILCLAAIVWAVQQRRMRSTPIPARTRSPTDSNRLTSSGTDAAFSFAAPNVLQRFYQQRGFALAWDDARAQALVEMVRAADTQGLAPADYLVGDLPALPPLSGLTGDARIDVDFELTEALLRYAYHNRFGKVDPHELDPSWNYARNVSPGGPSLRSNASSPRPISPRRSTSEVGHGAMYERAATACSRAIAALSPPADGQEVPAGTDVEAGQRRCARGRTATATRRRGFRRAAHRRPQHVR